MSMILLVELDWGNRDKLKKLSPEEQENVRKNVLALRETNFDEYFELRILTTEDELNWLRDSGFACTIKNFKNTYKPTSCSTPGKQYHYHLPNLGLMLVDEVDVEEDACTDRLQTRLNDGWRIIAVCPPNGQRRPDYILGRSKSHD